MARVPQTQGSIKPFVWRSRIRLVDEVVDVLRKRIYDGAYAPGEPLRQEQLSAELSVSRTPLREAFWMLEREGLVTMLPGGGARVITGDLDTLLAAYELRAVVDGVAARLAAKNPSAVVPALESLLKIQRRALEPWDPAAYTIANVEFHEAIITAADNEFVQAQAPLVRITSQVFAPVKVLDVTRAQAAVEEHRHIRDAIASGKAATAERVARYHIRVTIKSLSQKKGMVET
ncbi:MAG TPA: GntR family transcriptional regulator [Gaiellaceae bacterium]|jgi:DNA-binding GntR family transcriptional regulator